MAISMTITPSKGIEIITPLGGYDIRSGSWEDFSWNNTDQWFYFGKKSGTKAAYDIMVKYSDITSYNGGTVPEFTTLLAAIRTELKRDYHATDTKMFGEYGNDFITDTNVHVGDYYYIKAVTDTVVAAITYPSTVTVGGTAILTDADILKAGNAYECPFTSIKLTSGKIIAYKKS